MLRSSARPSQEPRPRVSGLRRVAVLSRSGQPQSLNSSVMQSPHDLDKNRPLTDLEYRLSRWMLESSSAEAQAFLPQLDLAEVTPWRCPCGCASLDFRIKGFPEAPPGVHPIADFVFGGKEDFSGIFLYESDGILSGLEVYGLASDAPKALPEPNMLRTWQGANPVG
jgi:hypothetical protein